MLTFIDPRETNPPKTLQAAFMTTFGYSASLIENLLKGGVKVSKSKKSYKSFS